MQRLDEGYAGYLNPFGNTVHQVSLLPEDVVCFVFWSKNFTPFMEELKGIQSRGYHFYFNYTITGLSSYFEKNVLNEKMTSENLQNLAEEYGVKKMNWRYDPIIISDITPVQYHIERFEQLFEKLAAYCGRCIISFATHYPKVKKQFEKLKKETGINVSIPSVEDKKKIVEGITKIASKNHLEINICCETELTDDIILPARCIDGDLINELFPDTLNLKFKKGSLRKNCGCCMSKDIGKYDTCPHGCNYCYANSNDKIIKKNQNEMDIESPILGLDKSKAALLLSGIKENIQAGLF